MRKYLILPLLRHQKISMVNELGKLSSTKKTKNKKIMEVSLNLKLNKKFNNLNLSLEINWSRKIGRGDVNKLFILVTKKGVMYAGVVTFISTLLNQLIS
jgi:hypothetical protein